MEDEYSERIEITFLYHPEDRQIYDLLNDHLIGLYRKGLIYEKSQVLAGATYEEQTKQRIEDVQIIVLLISRSFNRDDYYNSVELLTLLKSRAEKGVHVWPVIAKPVHWESTNFCEYEVFFGKPKSIIEYQPQDEAYRLIIEKINDEVVLMQAEACIRKGNTYRHQLEWDLALVAYEHSLNYAPYYLPALLEKGRTLHKQGKLENAQKCFEAVASYTLPTQQKNKNNGLNNMRICATNLCCKGYALLELQKLTEACTTFQEVYQQIGRPTNYFQRDILAKAYCGEGDMYMQICRRTSQPMKYLELALRVYEHAEAVSPEKQIYMVMIGKVYRIMGDTASDKASSLNFYEQTLTKCEQVIQHYSNYAPAYVEKADILTRLYRPEEALTLYENALKLDHYNAHAHGEKGYILLQLNNIQEALYAFETALRLESNNVKYLYGKGRGLALLGHYQDALNTYQEARNRGLKSADFFISCASAHLELGDVKYFGGQKEQAKDHYQHAFWSYSSALDRDISKRDIIFYGLGKASFALQDWEGALQHYRNAIGFAPYKADAYLGMGKTLLELGSITDAFSYFQEAYQRCHHPESKIDETDIYIARGEAYYRLADQAHKKKYYEYLTESQQYYSKAIQIRSHIMAYIGLAKTCAALYDYTEAITALDKALQLNPQRAECYFIKGQCYFMIGQPAEACSLYEKALHCGLDTVALRLAMGEALLEMKSYFRAKESFDIIIEHMQEKTAQAYCGRGIALYMLGIVEEALQSFEMANQLDSSIYSELQYRRVLEDICTLLDGKLRSDPEDASTFKWKGDILQLLGDRQEDALNAYTISIQCGNRTPEVYYCRSKVYWDLQEYRKADKDYHEALKLDMNNQNQVKQQIIKNNITQGQKNFLDKIAFWLTALLASK
jgi:tetratricopeptide (TPR) repeat protein